MKEILETRGRTILEAALARLVPAGAGPGAVEAGAVEYVARRLTAEGAEGLDLLERLAIDLGKASFSSLEPASQDEVLRALAAESPAGAACLRQLVLLALEGSFCHPGRGGNRNGAGWRFAGFGQDDEPAGPPRCRAS